MKERVHKAIQLMAKSHNVLKDTHGNISSISLEPGSSKVFIKPSGVPYESIHERDISVIENSVWISGLKPSVDLVHHLAIYLRFPWVTSICHTHSPYATSFAIAGKNIVCLSTEQSDYFGDDINCFSYKDLDSWGPLVPVYPKTKAILLEKHGILTFSNDPIKAVELAISLENCAEKNFLAYQLNENIKKLPSEEIKKWHKRYNNGTYGQ